MIPQIINKIKDECIDGIKSFYHYTTIDGIDGIITKKLLFATNIFYLNDIKEYIDVFNLFNKYCENNKETIDKYEFFDEFIGYADFINKNTLNHEVYVCSLTLKNDDLSQWRAYSGNGGYQIGFKKENLELLVQENGFNFYPCIYDDDTKNKIIKELIEGAIKRYEENYKLYKGDIEELERKIRIWLMNELTLCAPIFKNSSFKDECEWRLFINKPNDFSNQLYRKKDNLLIPYIEFNLEKDNQMYLSEILIGPGKNSGLSLKSIHSYMKTKIDNDNLNFNIDNIKLASVPYRSSW